MYIRPTFDLILGKPHQDGTYTLCLRVTHRRIPRLIALPNERGITEVEFKSIWKTKGVRADKRLTKDKWTQDYIIKAQKLSDNMKAEGFEDFQFQEFKNRYFGKIKEKKYKLYELYENIIEDYKISEKISTSEIYSGSLKFLAKILNVKPTSITYTSITPRTLKEIENYALKDDRFSITTVSIYLRCLKAVFNRAEKLKIISSKSNPFHNTDEVYRIPKVRNKKKALDSESLEKLKIYPENDLSPSEIKARDFWLISYYLYGINITDLLKLKNEDLNSPNIKYFRQKTKNSTREDQKEISILLHADAITLINKYRNTYSNPKGFLFQIITNEDDAKAQRIKIRNFTRFINQHIKKVAKKAGIDTNISTYYARHSFATKARNENIPVSKISNLLNHNSIKTTELYLDSLNNDELYDINKKVFGES